MKKAANNTRMVQPLALALFMASTSLVQADNSSTCDSQQQACGQAMDHSKMDHGSMDHSAMKMDGDSMPMDHSKMDHGSMDHSAMKMDGDSMPMDHSKMDHGSMDHSTMKMDGDSMPMDHSKMDHSQHQKMMQEQMGSNGNMPMDHSKMDHSKMDHSKMDHSKMDHGSMPMEHCDMMKDAGSMPMDHSAMNHGSMNHDMSGMQGGKAPANARDPHAWSGGYQMGHGPYIPESVHGAHSMGAHRFSALKVNELEQVNEGDNGIARASGEFWYGDTWDRAVLEFDAERDNGATDAELGAYWQHAYTAFWNTRLGVRQDISPEVKRTWLGAGFEGLAPYWFESEAMLFVGEEGVAELALHSDYDLLLSQRLILQPSLAANLHNKLDPQGQFDAGLSNTTLGLRLRYEISRQFAPYLGVEREHWFGGSADLVGERAVNRWMAGVKFWF